MGGAYAGKFRLLQRKVIELQIKYSSHMHYTNILQTNGILINNKWADFLLNNKFLFSISIDGLKLYKQ